MPRYCYRTPDKKILIEITQTVKEMTDCGGKIVLASGKVAFRDMVAEIRPQQGATDPWRKGLASEAAAVHPDQIREAKKYLERKGIKTEFTPDGRPVFRSRPHRKAHLEAFHLYDKDGGYGDARRRR